MFRTYAEWARLARDPAEWWRLSWDPTEWMRMGADLMSCGAGDRRFYGRRAEIQQLETLKKQLQDEIADIDDRIEKLRGGGGRQTEV